MKKAKSKAKIAPAKEYTPEQIAKLEQDAEAFREIKGYSEARPIRLPHDLTIGEYNFLVSYLRNHRTKILNSDPKIPKHIMNGSNMEMAVAEKPFKKDVN